MKKGNKVLAGVVFLLLIVGILFSQIKIKKIQVTGSKIYSEEQVKTAVMQDKFAYHSMYFWVVTHLRGVHEMPFAQEIDVKWNAMDDITLTVYDKAISGCVKYMGQYVYFDKDGIVLQSLSEKMENVPLISGITFGKFTINQKMDVKNDKLFDTIKNVSQLTNHYKLPVKEIHFAGTDVTLYTNRITINLGTKSFYDDDMVALSSVLKEAEKKKLSGTIDMEHYEPGNKIFLKRNNEKKTKKETGNDEKKQK